MPFHQRNTSTSASKGNIFSAIRRNQELEREKRLAQRKSFIDPAIRKVQGGDKPISILRAIQLSKPVNVTSQIAKPVSIKNQVASSNISPQQKNIQDLQRAFPATVIGRNTTGSSPFETETIINTRAGGTRLLKGSQALQDRLASNIARSRIERALTSIQASLDRFNNIFGGN